ncbi:MAG: 16S rRNA (cytidine(1402)-2'-O)-methyltransferase [Patescibacteria group bacterium]
MIYIVPTPIGNLGDITHRSEKALNESSWIICEDTRQTAKLLDLLNIRQDQKLISMLRQQQFNFNQINRALDEYSQNKQSEDQEQHLSIVSDAGTPGISDPGYEVIQMLIDKGLEYTVLPGAVAFVPALVASGLPMQQFQFVGFLPVKKGRQTQIKQMSENINTTFILYESPHRISKLFQELTEFLPTTTQIFMAREISKLHEQYWRGTVADLTNFQEDVKGEIVLVIYIPKLKHV